MKKTWILVMLGFAVGFGGGFGLSRLVSSRQQKENFYSFIAWAVKDGLLTVNTNRLSDLVDREGASP